MEAYASLEHCHRQYACAFTSREKISKQCSSKLLNHRIVKGIQQMGFGILPGPVRALKFSSSYGDHVLKHVTIDGLSQSHS